MKYLIIILFLICVNVYNYIRLQVQKHLLRLCVPATNEFKYDKYHNIMFRYLKWKNDQVEIKRRQQINLNSSELVKYI